ncbi:MAG: carboxymuconolactone decarboxylase family protein [Acidimicrobiales bacterium]
MDLERTRRIEPVTHPLHDDVADLLRGGIERSGLAVVPDFHAVLANHPELLRRILGLGLGRMPDSELTVRQREVLVLRTARRCSATYEWAHHRRRAGERGLTMEDVRLAWEGPSSAETPEDRVLLQVADELHDTSTVAAGTWDRLCETVGAPAAIEAVAVVGWFHLIAYLGNALGLEVEVGVDATFGPPEGA